ncbi:tetratricopeptide repeat protein [[Muricauda] lutisoli]|uniref:Tetratricopeptide repeat protein n=1 Tax=[Muricauda] lutisoli TaxID=2816035 RepID=A0ABS3ESI4_9FLAO|nr:tetratricopeptide repeat protein [[Muricauda] lutisoli]MBO0329110.1 tetratricopeptide repeat protein [[Muricauda] lutisoli]
MRLSFAEQIQNANVLLHENEVERSIENYQEALQMASDPMQKLHLNSILGRLYQRTKSPKKAIEAFNNALTLMEGDPNLGTSIDRASILNNIAAIQSETEKVKAIENYKKSSAIYAEAVEKGKIDYYPHLANTQFALAEVYAKKNDFYFAKKYYKEAIKIYENLKDRAYIKLRASAHYQLGNIYTEEFNLFDAKVHYMKAQTLFENLIEEGYETLKPYLAAVLNNLAVTFNAMEEPEKSLQYYDMALKAYQELSDRNFDVFQPYVASTFNSLGIVHSEMQNFDQAIQNISEAVDRYNELADARPQEYTHYLATGLHNLGLFHFELRNYDKAMCHFDQALEIRKKLASEQPEDFDADYCATALNLVELYQSELENKVDFNFKVKALQLLADVEIRLGKYVDNLPVIKNMKNDLQHYLDYFTSINEERLSLHHVLRKVNNLKEQIDETIYPKEKMVFQKEIMKLLKYTLNQYSSNDRLKYELALAHVNMSWLQLRLKEFHKAEQTILDAPIMESPLLSLTCNLAHSYLLKDQTDKAMVLYEELSEKVNNQNESYMEIILKDFETLRRDGIDHDGFKTVTERFK